MSSWHRVQRERVVLRSLQLRHSQSLVQWPLGRCQNVKKNYWGYPPTPYLHLQRRGAGVCSPSFTLQCTFQRNKLVSWNVCDELQCLWMNAFVRASVNVLQKHPVSSRGAKLTGVAWPWFAWIEVKWCSIMNQIINSHSSKMTDIAACCCLK